MRLPRTSFHYMLRVLPWPASSLLPTHLLPCRGAHDQRPFVVSDDVSQPPPLSLCEAGRVQGFEGFARFVDTARRRYKPMLEAAFRPARCCAVLVALASLCQVRRVSSVYVYSPCAPLHALAVALSCFSFVVPVLACRPVLLDNTAGRRGFCGRIVAHPRAALQHAPVCIDVWRCKGGA